MKQILGNIRRADEDYGMIRPGDRVAVGLSGGKDSLVLLRALSLYRKFAPRPFSLFAVTIDMGLRPFDLAGVEALCASLEVPYVRVETEIGRIVFSERSCENPCSLCSRLRRGALAQVCREHGWDRLALGHHRDDALETLLMSALYEGRLRTFRPVTEPEGEGVVQIRPMVYCTEKQILGAARKLGLPTMASPCPADGKTARAEMKELLDALCRRHPNARAQLLTALKNDSEYALWTR